MPLLPKQYYSVVEQILEALDLDGKEKRQYIDQFEQLLLAEFAAALAKKLPKHESKKIISLANSADTEEKKKEVFEGLKSWLNKAEVKALFLKVADKVFSGFLQTAYKDANGSQKKKLEEKFKSEILKG